MNQPSPLPAIIQTILRSSQPVIDAIQAGESQLSLGLQRAARLPVLAALYQAYQQPFLLITDRTDRALSILEELEFWLPDAPRLLFPEPNPLFYENAAWGENTRRERLTALTTLASYHIPASAKPERPPVLIAPIRALMTRTLPRRNFLKAAQTLKTGQTLQLGELAKLCVRLGYEPANIVIAPGQFARRGGILDIWPSSTPLPLRVEFFGDEIDTMRSFDPSTQRTTPPQDETAPSRLLITPAREYLIPPDFEPPDPNFELNEFMIPVFHRTPASLIEYLPPQSLILLDNGQAVQDAISDIEAQALELRQDSIDEGTLPADFPVPYLTQEEIAEMSAAYRQVNLGPGPLQNGEARGEAISVTALSSRFQTGPRFSGRLKSFLEYLTARFQKGEQLVIISRQYRRLQELWNEQPLPKDGKTLPVFIEGSLSDGWDFYAGDGQVIHLLTDGEVFGWRRPEPRRRPKRFAEAPETGFADLQIDDYVVHVDHGIGRYAGLVRRSVEGVEREYLSVEFADEAQLFVPVHQSDRLTRYVGPDNRPPALARLGSQEWRGVKANVKEAVQEVAEDLLELYAKRSIVEGHRFGPDSSWQQELEASFPYIETDDQMRVLAEVKRDMEAPRPMDRLICGDVGYGKTEVALRAAFKAVMDSRQVAILVPTTVLAQQHYQTFTERLAAFPVSVEMLSRFRSPQRQQQIVKDLAQGKIDIVIGTHRMLSSDVQFKDLGLLIIDEEQRFGVTHKEQLKKMRTEVDVLTLTATPIPRTLYMALSGVRDISTINTPPEERLPIVTHVGPYSPRLVKQAILREMERGGQVFFVHNRVQTIGAMLTHLTQLVPEARIAIAHGQMNETELAGRMEAFTKAEIDVLLSTSIIESGLDIPNANTLIVDRADTFGLAQLYQLRGRVGRGAQRAYAYFFRHNRKSPTYDGRQRLETIAENTQLGAGYSIAMRDLEIRGTGDILGSRQHGHIAAVGFHLYTNLLSQAVQQLRKEQGLPEALPPVVHRLQMSPVNVELPLPAAIPADYVADKKVRLGLYRRMANLRTRAELDAMAEELADRFGPVPEAVQNLFTQFRIKLLAERAGLSSITVENGQIVLRFPSGNVPEDLPPLAAPARVGKTAVWLPTAHQPDWIADLIEILEQLKRDEPVPEGALL
ncbi:MAG: transcription-repair coupling factor [Anaerolineales bacterium]|nr:transcription-repair coupling factor [Anaerolineales bacterium]